MTNVSNTSRCVKLYSLYLINEVITLFFNIEFTYSPSRPALPRPVLRSQVLPAGETGELHPAADPPEPLLRLPGEV